MKQGKNLATSPRQGSPASTEKLSQAARKRVGRFDLGIVREKVIPLLEFAWASGLLDWTPEQYERAMIWMFPETFVGDPVAERARYAVELNKKRAEIMSRAGDTRKPSGR